MPFTVNETGHGGCGLPPERSLLSCILVAPSLGARRRFRTGEAQAQPGAFAIATFASVTKRLRLTCCDLFLLLVVVYVTSVAAVKIRACNLAIFSPVSRSHATLKLIASMAVSGAQPLRDLVKGAGVSCSEVGGHCRAPMTGRWSDPFNSSRKTGRKRCP